MGLLLGGGCITSHLALTAYYHRPTPLTSKAPTSLKLDPILTCKQSKKQKG